MKRTISDGTLAAVSVCCALGLGGTASAGPFLFDPDGGGGSFAPISVSTIDWAPGNTLAINGNSPGGLVVGNTIENRFQANLEFMANGLNASVFSNGAGGNFFTVVAAFSEVVTSVSVGGGVAVATSDDLAVPAASIFKICKHTALANDLTGGGFGCTGADVILSGRLTDLVLSTLTINLVPAPPAPGSPNPDLLDRHNTDDWSGQPTLLSSGSASILVTIDSLDSSYFPNLSPGSVLTTALNDIALITPYGQVDPSYCFTDSTGSFSSTSGTSVCDNGSEPGFGTLGAVNGLPAQAAGGLPVGPNFMFESDARTSIAVPEPDTMALVGLSLLGFAGARRRREQVLRRIRRGEAR